MLVNQPKPTQKPPAAKGIPFPNRWFLHTQNSTLIRYHIIREHEELGDVLIIEHI